MWEIDLISYEGARDKRVIESTRIEVVLAEVKVLIEKFRVVKITDLDRKKYEPNIVIQDGSLHE